MKELRRRKIGRLMRLRERVSNFPVRRCSGGIVNA